MRWGGGRWVATCFNCNIEVTRDALNRKIAKDHLAHHDKRNHGLLGLGRMCLRTWHRLPSTAD